MAAKTQITFRTDVGSHFDPDDIEQIEITRQLDGSTQVRLYFRSTCEMLTFEFAKLKKAIEFYQVLWSSRTLPSTDEEELVNVDNQNQPVSRQGR